MKKILQLTLTLFFTIGSLFISLSQDANRSEINAFISKSGAKPSFDQATNNLSFMQFPMGRPYSIGGNSPTEKALTFLSDNNGLFNSKRLSDSHQVKESLKDNYGMDHVLLQQYYKGVPVFDGILKFHFNKNTELTSFNGNFISIEKLNPIPTITNEQAEQTALKIIEKMNAEQNSTNSLVTNQSNLFVFQKGLAQGYKGQVHLVYEVEVKNNSNIREFLYIDAHTKELVEQFTGIHNTGLDRRLYETNYNPLAPATNLIWTEGETLPDPDGGGPRAALDIWQQSEVESAGQMYNMMKNAFGHGSYNGGATLATESPMITVNNDPNIQCPNANWNGTTANYCTGVATDDVVAHEWGHAYTEYTNNLIYAWQAGALNESYSDVWGETVDQLNSYFDGGETSGLRTDCGSSSKWLMGEQSTSFGGAIRDMWNPQCYGDPGKVSDPQYYCLATDAGGVHSNSGIPNHAFALLVDGGTYNGQTITGIGRTKAAHIWWYAQKNFITRTTDFSAFADMLEASLNALIGVNLNVLSTATGVPTPSGISITATDLNELQKVLIAVEMRLENKCGFAPAFQPLPTICLGGTPANAIYFEDFEDGLTGWITSNSGGASTLTRNWVSSSTPPTGKTGKVAFAQNFDIGDCSSSFAGQISLESPTITIPAFTTAPNLAFDHYFSVELGYDGGNLQYSLNGGTTYTTVPLAAFIANGYTSNLATSAGGNNNPMAGQPAFTGGGNGSINSGWGQSRINLLALGILDFNTSPQNIKFKWRLGQDGCGAWLGWFIDDVRLYSCANPTVQFATEKTEVNEFEANVNNVSPNLCLPYVEKIVTIKINKAPSSPVTVTMNTPTGTAKLGDTKDFTFTPNSFILDASNLSKNVTVRIYDDENIEGKETFTLSYSLSGGGDAIPETFYQTHTFTINDNEIEPGVVETQVLFENFQNGIPSGWKTLNSSGVEEAVQFSYPSSWGVNNLVGSLDPSGTNKLFANSDASAGSFDKIVETAPFNTLGASKISLSFLEYFRIYNANDDIFNESGTIEVWNGSTWNNILTHFEYEGNIGSFTYPYNNQINIPIAYANAAMKLRFRYTANFDYYWAIDNIKVIASLPIVVQSAVNTPNPPSAYLGPNETAAFYDPTSGNLIAKIKNLSAHDYGCTTVEIDRAGNGEVVWFGPYKISAKTYKVTPTTNNPTGKYEITFYYKNVEIAGSTINSMGKTSVNALGKTIAYASVRTGNVFNSDYSYTATFDSGFSGFGLSDAQPVVGPLPVTLTKFDGKYTSEGNILNWATSAETNNDMFILERSTNAKEFKELASIKSKGNNVELANYNYLDDTHSQGINYYRLKQIDKDGKYGYSKLIAIDAPISRAIKISPNPVQSILNLSLPNLNNEMVELKLINALGQEIMQKIVKVKDGEASINMSQYAPGIYQLILIATSKTHNFKILKQ